MCNLLGVSRSGYYKWRNREPSSRDRKNRQLLKKIRRIHTDSRETYGSPRVHAALKAEGVNVGKNRVARLMREDGLKGVTRRRWPTTTVRQPHARPAPDLVDRDFDADAPDELWVADITYVPTRPGFVYLAVVMDAFSRRIVGWAMTNHLRTELVTDALDMAIDTRQPEEVIHHSDQGCQYTSLAFGKRCKRRGIRPSMGSVGDCYDNAMCESFFATLECELIDREYFASRNEAEMEVFSFVEGFYNPHRLHSSLDYLSPINYERRYEHRLAQ